MGELKPLVICENNKEFIPPAKCLLKRGKNAKKVSNFFNQNCYPRILESFTLPSLGVFHKESMRAYEDVKEGLKYLFQTKNRWTFAISGPEENGMEAILCNLLEPGDTILVGVNGYNGSLMCETAARLKDVQVQKFEKPFGNIFTFEEISQAVEEFKPKILFITHSESNSGFVQDLKGVGELCRKHDCLFATYTAGLGCIPFKVDELLIDAVYSSSETVISPLGLLAPISFSDRAVQVVRARKTKVPTFYLDMEKLAHQFYANELEVGHEELAERYHITPAVASIICLREGLAVLVEEGLENMFQLQLESSERLWFGIETLGLEFYIENEKNRLPNVTCIRVPKGLEWIYISEFAMDKFQVEINGGLVPSSATENGKFDQILRIWLMGYNCTPAKIDKTLQALKEGLEFAKLHSRLY